MDKARSNIIMVIDTKESGRTAKNMDRANMTIIVVIDTKESGRMAK